MSDKSLFFLLAETYERHRLARRAAAADGPQPPQPRPLVRFLRWLVPNGGTILVVLALVLTQQVWARPAQQQLNAPGPSATTVNYQGRLADAAGNPLDGSYAMSFSLWDAPSTGNLIWGLENHPTVPVSGGLFSVGLGSQTSGGIPTTVWDGDRYLEITVGGETLIPRELIRSVPIAGMALTVPDGAIGTAQVMDGSIESRDVRLTVGRAAATGGTMALTDQYQDVPGTAVTLTPDSSQSYLVYVTADLETRDALALAALFVDGAAQDGQALFSGGGSAWGRGTVSQVYLVNLDAGTHNLVIRARKSSGTDAWISGHTTVTYLAVSQ